MADIKQFENKVICGDCLEVMKEIPSNTIDTIISDVPYGIKFMGKKWDYDVPSVEIFEEMLRVAKPGATALIFAGARTQHKIATNIEDAGWILKDVIMWIMGSGFPKATDISKQLDKRAGKEPIKVSRNPNSREKCDKSNTIYESGTVGKTDFITKPNTKQAQLWNGWKSHGLKPAYEPIIVAMKPNEGSYANNALKWGVSGLNIDGGRIEYEKTPNPATNPKYRVEKGYALPQKEGSKSSVFVETYKTGDPEAMKKMTQTGGRFPANIILDSEAAELLDEMSGECKSGKYKGQGSKSGGIWRKSTGLPAGEEYGDSGGASRFFKIIK